MPTEKFTNNFSTTLNGAIDDSQTTIVLTDATGLPSTGNVRLLCESEIMLMTARSGNSLTVTRGIEGSSAAAHIDTTAVYGILTKGALDTFRADLLGRGTHAAIPAASQQGDLYFPTDSIVMAQDTGAEWQYHWLPKWYPLDDSSWSWVNQGSANRIAAGGVTYIQDVNNGNELRCRVKTCPATPYKIWTRVIPMHLESHNDVFCGLCWRESSSGKIIIAGFRGNSNFLCYYCNTASNPSYSSIYDPGVAFQSIVYGQPGWSIGLEDNNTNKRVVIIPDGLNAIEVVTMTHAYQFVPDQVGFWVKPRGSLISGISCMSWREFS